MSPLFFFFNDTATTEIYTLSLHDALPILDVDHGTRDVDPLLGRHLLPDQRHREQRGEVIGTDRLLRHRVQGRKRLHLLRSEEHTSELQSPCNLVCRLLLEKKKKDHNYAIA